MSRHAIKKRDIDSDTKYNSSEVALLINYIMLDGKKSLARSIVYDSFDIVKKQEKTEKPLETFIKAVRNIGPLTELRSRRVGGANYQIPIEVRSARRLTLALRWLVIAARSKSGQAMSKSLASEIIAASKNEGTAVSKKENIHKMAEANKAFAHLG